MKGEHPIQKKARAGAEMVKMASGGKVYAKGGSAYRSSCDGVAKKGKTKGKMIKMAMGGKC